jgi:outer membrane protein OmpA-like peptidoglycan-associated protein
MKTLIIVLFTLALSSCSSVHHKRTEILARGDSIAVLDTKVQQALLSDLNILAPEGFSKAKILLDKAMQEAQKGKSTNAGTQTAMDGIAIIEDAERMSEQNRPILSDTLAKRADAITAQADFIFPQEFARLERDLNVTAKALENGKQQEGIGKSAVLASAYANLEMKATKVNVGESASSAYDAAVKAHALKYAPSTMAKAKTEIDIAKRIIEVEKGEQDKAALHAKRGCYFANQAKNIADTLTAFRKERLTDEEKVLWFQEQLSLIHKAHEPDGVAFNKPNREVVAKLQDKVSSLVAGVELLKDTAAQTNAEKDRAIAEQSKPNALFESISNLFNDDEATVLKRENDIIIRAYGFNFPINESVLLSSNYPLLKKIVTAIKHVPNAQITVEGHTDSTGSARVNLNLSKARAQNIADYLTKVASVDERRVSAIGLGYQRPLVHEGTKQERTVNRRIEIVIKN